MLKQYKLTLILSSLATLVPVPAGLLLGWSWRSALMLPLLLLAAHWFGVFWTVKDPGNRNQNPKPLRLVLWIMPVVSNFTCFVNYALTVGLEFTVSRVYCLVFGIMFAVIGNYLPKVRQNSTLGIKLPWAYTSPENWAATHRFGGKVWVICGVIMLLAALLPQNWGVVIMLTVIAAACIVPTVYSYAFYRRQKARGDVLLPVQSFAGRTGRWSVVFLAALAVFVCCVLFTGNIAYEFHDNYLLVDADYHEDLVLAYDGISSVEYRDGNVDGVRVWGYGSLRLLMGSFQNDEFGTYVRYTYYDPQSTVVLKVKDQVYVLSGSTPEETRTLYEDLCQRVGR